MSAVSVWLIAVGGVATAVGFFGSPPSGGGLRFWNPLSRRARLLWSGAAAGTVLLTVGGLVALFGGDSHHVNRALVVASTGGVLALLIYGFNVRRLLYDRRIVLQHFAPSSAEFLHPMAKRMATVSWCLRHPLHNGMWERRDPADAIAQLADGPPPGPEPPAAS